MDKVAKRPPPLLQKQKLHKLLQKLLLHKLH